MSNPEISQRLEQELNWKMTPFMMTEGIEVLENITMEQETGRNLESDYKDMREKLIKDNFIVIGVMARNNAGKGSMLMGFTRLFRTDEYLHDVLAKTGVDLEILSFPFAHCARAAMLPEVGIVSKDVKFAGFSVEETKKISKFQWEMINSHALSPDLKYKKDTVEYFKQQKKAKVIIFESSSPLAYPVSTDVPVEVGGFEDNGNSTFYNVALDPRTKKNAYLYIIDRDKRLEDEESMQFRKKVRNEEIDDVFKGETKTVVTLPNGTESAVCDLPKEQQEKLKTILSVSMAPAEVSKKFDEELNELEIKLHGAGLIDLPNDESYFAFLKEKVKGKIIIAKNPYFLGHKTYDLDYLINSFPARLYPKILEK